MLHRSPGLKRGFRSVALDACMRGLESLWFLNCNGTEMDEFNVNEKREEFQYFAEELRTFSEGLERVDVVRLGLVIEQLEFVIYRFAGLELEEQSSTLPSSWANGSSNETKARTPPPGMIIWSITQTNDHGFDLGGSSSIDMMTNDAFIKQSESSFYRCRCLTSLNGKQFSKK